MVVSFNPSERVELYSAHVALKTACGEAVVVKDLSRQEIITLSTRSNLAFQYEHSSTPQGLPAALAVEAITSHPDAQRFFSVAAHELVD